LKWIKRNNSYRGSWSS